MPAAPPPSHPSPPSPPPPSAVVHPVIISTDPGIDDALAIFLALRSPELDVRAICTCYGNTTAQHAFRNAVEITRRAGRRVPLGAGARKPLARPLATAAETHGESGLGYAVVPAAGLVLDHHWTLERLLEREPAPVTLLTLGPVTDLALVLRQNDDVVRAKVARHVAMVGNLAAPGNTTSVAEFNAWCDPEALEIVLAAELPTEMIGLDVTRHLWLGVEEVAALGEAQDADAQWLHDALRFYLEFHRRAEHLDGCVVNDPLAVLAVFRPDLLRFETTHLVVDTSDEVHRGHTREDAHGARVRAALRVRADEAKALLVERVLPWLSTHSPTAIW